jgi:enoyl-CoA hydratase
MNYQTILYEQIGSVARIWHNRPDQRNAENAQLLDELDDAVARAADDAGIRVIILAGKGRHFSAGHDLKELGPAYLQLPTEARYAYEDRRFYKYALRIWEAPKPTIAQVQGGCIAGAFAVAAMCDLLIAAEDAFFTDPTVQLGSAAVEVLFHPWVLGSRLAADILYTGRRIEAREALAVGLATRVVPLGELESATLALAEQIAKAPPFATKLTKRSLQRTMQIQGFRAALDAHFDTHQLAHTGTETPETGTVLIENIKQRVSSDDKSNERAPAAARS